MRMPGNWKASRILQSPNFVFCRGPWHWFLARPVRRRLRTFRPVTHQRAATPLPETCKFVGAETCKNCYDEIYNTQEKTPHWRTTLNTRGGPSKQGRGNQGPGADHVAGELHRKTRFIIARS